MGRELFLCSFSLKTHFPFLYIHRVLNSQALVALSRFSWSQLQTQLWYKVLQHTLHFTVPSLWPDWQTSTMLRTENFFHICQYSIQTTNKATLIHLRLFFKVKSFLYPGSFSSVPVPKGCIVNQAWEYNQLRSNSQGVGKMYSQPDFSPAYPRYSCIVLVQVGGKQELKRSNS